MPELDVLPDVSGVGDLRYPVLGPLLGGELGGCSPVVRPQEEGRLIQQPRAAGDEGADGLAAEDLVFGRGLPVEFGPLR
jgi:hypothetical protein